MVSQRLGRHGAPGGKRRCVERDTLVRLLVQTAAGLPRPDCSLLVCRTVRSAAWSRLVVETAWAGGFALSGQDAWMCRFAAGDCQIVIQSAPCTVLCRLGKHADCNAVFQSAGAKLFGWISLGELSLAYFATSLFWGLSLAENPAALFRWLDVLAIPFVVYSLGWQIRHRRWCTLCLAIDAVLLADFGVELFFGPDKVVERGLWIDVAGYCVVFACMVLGIRRSVTQAEMAVEMPRLLALREHLLSDSDLFELQLARCREEPVRSGSASPLHNGVESGRTVTVVMNPSCPKCARVHRQLGLLGDCRVELLFAVNDGDHLSNDAALLIITTWITKGWAEADRQIGIWYERREMIVRTKIHPQAISILQAHRSYCQAVGIEGTPTVLVDNRRLPDTYDVEDLKYLF